METSIPPPHPPLLLLCATCGIKIEREKYERKIERDETEAFGWRVGKKNPFQVKQHGK